MNQKELNRLKKGEELSKEIEELKQSKAKILRFKGIIKEHEQKFDLKVFAHWKYYNPGDVEQRAPLDKHEEILPLPPKVVLDVLLTHINNALEIKQDEFDKL